MAPLTELLPVTQLRCAHFLLVSIIEPTPLPREVERKMNPSKYLTIGIVAFAMAGCTQTLVAEPGPGKLAAGVKVLVDDGTCPEGQIKQITGGNRNAGIERKRECIARNG